MRASARLQPFNVRPTCPGVPWGVRGPKTTAKPFKRSLCAKPLERISEKTSPQKKNPEGYGLQPVHKCIHRGPALAAEGRIFPSIQRHHEKNTSHT